MAAPNPNSRRDAIVALLSAGLGPTAIAKKLGVTKNVVVGISARAGLNTPGRGVAQPTTLGGRLDALHAKLDAVLAETVGVGKVPNEPRTDALASKPLGVRYNAPRH